MNNSQDSQGYIFSLESMTYAHKARNHLAAKGYRAEIARAEGCGHGVKAFGSKDEIIALLAAAGIRVNAVRKT